MDYPRNNTKFVHNAIMIRKIFSWPVEGCLRLGTVTKPGRRGGWLGIWGVRLGSVFLRRARLGG